jgi:hypothetical protein
MTRKKLTSESLKQIAPGAAMVLLAGPIFLFMAMDIILFLIMSRTRGMTASTQIFDLSMEIVLCLFAGLVTAFGARKIWRELRKT